MYDHPPRSGRKDGPSSRTSFRHVASGYAPGDPGTPGRPRVPARPRVLAGDRAYSRVPRTRGPGLRGTPRNLTPERTRDRARVLPRCFARVLAGERAYSREFASRE